MELLKKIYWNLLDFILALLAVVGELFVVAVLFLVRLIPSILVGVAIAYIVVHYIL
jgi:hypothetical protein